MKKEIMVEKLLGLHCKNCQGEIFGCKGCDFEEQIKSIVYDKTR